MVLNPVQENIEYRQDIMRGTVMKQKTTAAFLLILAIFVFCHMKIPSASQAIRTYPPVQGSTGDQYYYNKDVNPFYPELAPYYKRADGYVTGNCTWYAWGRVCEIAGGKLPHMFTGDAGTWWKQNKTEGWYSYGSTPERGAIVCYRTHIAVVEQAEPLMVSESGWKLEKEKNSLIFNCGEPWRGQEEIIGYIYTQKQGVQRRDSNETAN